MNGQETFLNCYDSCPKKIRDPPGVPYLHVQNTNY